MSRVILTDEQWEQIDAQVGATDDVECAASSLTPDLLALNFPPHAQMPVAAVCFHDCADALRQIRYALCEYFAHGTSHQEEVVSASEPTAIFYKRYYLDDAALRAYAAAEHLANAVICMLEVTDEQLAPYRKTNRVSQQSMVAAFLAKERSDWPLTAELLALGRSDAWTFTMNYRNRWVHEQPPTVAGRGVQYRRRTPWRASANGQQRFLAIGAGDTPEYEISSLEASILAAYHGLLQSVKSGLDEYFAMLSAHGVTRDGSRTIVKMKFPRD